jgi:hypothetical protein
VLDLYLYHRIHVGDCVIVACPCCVHGAAVKACALCASNQLLCRQHPAPSPHNPLLCTLRLFCSAAAAEWVRELDAKWGKMAEQLLGHLPKDVFTVAVARCSSKPSEWVGRRGGCCIGANLNKFPLYCHTVA